MRRSFWRAQMTVAIWRSTSAPGPSSSMSRRASQAGIVGMNGGFGGLDGEAVHDLHGGGKLAGGDDVGDGLGGGGDGVEGGEDDLNRLGLAHDAEGHFGGDAEGAFGADEDAEQIVAGSVGRFAAEGDDLAGGEDDGHLEDVGDGEAVLEAVGAAGVFGDVAADGADGSESWGRARRRSPAGRRRR